MVIYGATPETPETSDAMTRLGVMEGGEQVARKGGARARLRAIAKGWPAALQPKQRRRHVLTFNVLE